MASLVEYTSPKWRNLNMRDLKVDEAYMSVTSELDHRVWLYSLSDGCYNVSKVHCNVISYCVFFIQCPYTKVGGIPPETSETIKIDVERSLYYRVYDKDLGKYVNSNE